MDKNRTYVSGRGEGSDEELSRLLARVPPPRAPGWFLAKTMARLRAERSHGVRGGIFVSGWRWVLATGVAVVLAAAWLRWQAPRDQLEISDAMVFSALDALAEQDAENNWWAGL